ncbi:hypothetical protein CALCODRAFT_263067 [Calocera cornea HHB12733]|uniref:Uncharacterized protein n=1 Tax=Calocera cornea HHB12733 TaxID=1353952 RepID=A0A165GGG2_9BASI|nr:hypothetical protein CALCODRAFT_263067 [Calocera cornea HHB12733]
MMAIGGRRRAVPKERRAPAWQRVGGRWRMTAIVREGGGAAGPAKCARDAWACARGCRRSMIKDDARRREARPCALCAVRSARSATACERGCLVCRPLMAVRRRGRAIESADSEDCTVAAVAALATVCPLRCQGQLVRPASNPGPPQPTPATEGNDGLPTRLTPSPPDASAHRDADYAYPSASDAGHTRPRTLSLLRTPGGRG